MAVRSRQSRASCTTFGRRPSASLRWRLISTAALLAALGAGSAQAADTLQTVKQQVFVSAVMEKVPATAVARPVVGHPEPVASSTVAPSPGQDAAELRAELERLRRERDEAVAAKLEMKGRWAAAEDRAVAASNQLLRMERELKVQKAEVAQLSGRLVAGKAELADLQADLDETRQELHSTQQRALALAQARGLLSLRLARSEIGSIRERQQQDRLFLQLAARTQTSVTAIETLLESTGLDVDRLVKLVPQGGQGGPFVPLESGLQQAAGRSDSLAASLVAPRIEERLERWHAIASLLRVLPFSSPVEKIAVTSSFGGRRDPFTGRTAFHEGIDFDGPSKTPIRAAAAGTVVFAGRQRGYGNIVEIDHGYGVETRYAHLRSLNVEKGEKVDAGEIIGRMGSTGRSTGTHLHYEVRLDGRPTNPLSFVEFGQILQAAMR